MIPGLEEKFANSHPKTVECLQGDYEHDKDAIDTLAARYGYRFLGFRFSMAIFTSKRIDPLEDSVCDLGFIHRVRPE